MLNSYTKAMEEEEFSEYPLNQVFHEYQVSNISIEDHSWGKWTKSFPGQKFEKYQENAEFSPTQNDDSTMLVPIEGTDGIYEFINLQENDSFSEQKREELADFGKLKRIKSRKIKEPPYRFMGNLLMTFPHSENNQYSPAICMGSGTLIGPNHVLTAAHNLYDHKRGGWAQHVIFTPSQHKEEKPPFGNAKGKILKTFNQWISSKNDDYDMGIIILDSRIGDKAGWAGLLSDWVNKPENVHLKVQIAGYPQKKAKINCFNVTPYVKTARMYKHEGKIESCNERRLTYKISTEPGQSGSPIVAYIKEFEDYFVLGVHTHGVLKKHNEGTLISLSNIEKIMKEVSRYTLISDTTTPSELATQKMSTHTLSSSPTFFLGDNDSWEKKIKVELWSFGIEENIQYIKNLRGQLNLETLKEMQIFYLQLKDTFSKHLHTKYYDNYLHHQPHPLIFEELAKEDSEAWWMNSERERSKKLNHYITSIIQYENLYEQYNTQVLTRKNISPNIKRYKSIGAKDLRHHVQQDAQDLMPIVRHHVQDAQDLMPIVRHHVQDAQDLIKEMTSMQLSMYMSEAKKKHHMHKDYNKLG
jgi:V8-like Glu-specific endopeptidase